MRICWQPWQSFELTEFSAWRIWDRFWYLLTHIDNLLTLRSFDDFGWFFTSHLTYILRQALLKEHPDWCVGEKRIRSLNRLLNEAVSSNNTSEERFMEHSLETMRCGLDEPDWENLADDEINGEKEWVLVEKPFGLWQTNEAATSLTIYDVPRLARWMCSRKTTYCYYLILLITRLSENEKPRAWSSPKTWGPSRMCAIFRPRQQCAVPRPAQRRLIASCTSGRPPDLHQFYQVAESYPTKLLNFFLRGWPDKTTKFFFKVHKSAM